MVSEKEVLQYMELVYRPPHYDDDEIQALIECHLSTIMPMHDIQYQLEKEMLETNSTLLDVIIRHRKMFHSVVTSRGHSFKMVLGDRK